eukprot:38177-Ditylum_brightwellii.AAC.1
MEATVSQMHDDLIYEDHNDASTLDNKIGVSSIATKTRHSTVTPERASDIFSCSMEKLRIPSISQHSMDSEMQFIP